MKPLFALLLLVGCAETLTQEEREYKNVENALKWDRCQEIYNELGKPTVSRHIHGKTRKHRPDEIREDLMLNNCHQILKRMGWD